MVGMALMKWNQIKLELISTWEIVTYILIEITI